MSCNLKEYKEFIDNEMLLILGQMDKATLIFDHVYLVRIPLVVQVNSVKSQIVIHLTDSQTLAQFRLLTYCTLTLF